MNELHNISNLRIFHLEMIMSTYSCFYSKGKLRVLITIQHNNQKKRGQLSESNVCQHGVGTLSMSLTFIPGYLIILNLNCTYNPMCFHM